MITAFSNEGRIQQKLAALGCSYSAFCKLAGICGKTRFMEAMNGLPGRHFSDDEAQALLFTLEELWQLQTDVDEAARGKDGKPTHVPIDFSQYDQVKTALTVRLAKNCLNDGDTCLDEVM
ncbi:MAG: hypothetical protein JO119_10285, partial [Acidobacteria bacterium]|nr:hypothetical protein [Acidobacteriota bacterium]